MKQYATITALGMLLALSGCRTTPRPTTQPAPGLAPGMTPGSPFAPHGAVAPPGNPYVPPGAVPYHAQPGTQPFIPPGAVPGAAVPGAPGGAPAPMFPSTSQFAPGAMQADYRWQPAPGGPTSVFLMPPEPIITEQRKSDSPPLPEPPRIKETQQVRLDVVEPMNDAKGFRTAPGVPALPVGIPQFSRVVDRVAAGLRPSLDEGLDWLQASGYRTVLFVRAPGEDDSADRKQVEKRGMNYLSLEASPQTLSRELVDTFSRVVGDSTNYPLFVYDRDGALAGGLWYLHFRTAEQLSDDAARIRAGSLGLREDRDDGHRLMWLGIQKFLADR